MRSSSRLMLIVGTAVMVVLASLLWSSPSRGQESTPPPDASAACDGMGAVGTPDAPQYARTFFEETSLLAGYTLRLSKIVFEPGESIAGNLDAAIWTYVECGELNLTVQEGTVTVEQSSGTVTTLTEDDTFVLHAGDALFVDGLTTTIELKNESSDIAVVTTAALVSTSNAEHGCDNLPCRGWP